jgi:hypothetical protein
MRPPDGLKSATAALKYVFVCTKLGGAVATADRSTG